MRIRVRSALTAGFGIIVGLFALATLVTVGSVGRVSRLEENLAGFDRAKHEGHLTLSAVQKVFIQQSQILILGQPQQWDRYREACDQADQRLRRLEEAGEAVGVTEGISEIGRILTELQRYFETEVVPDLGAPRAEHIRLHDHLASLTERAGVLNRDLNAVLEGKATEVRSELRKVLGLTQAVTLTMLSLSVLVAVVIGIVLVRFIAHPVADLQQAVKTISAGDLNARVSAEGPLELLDLARRFNDMVSALEESRDLVAQQERRAAIGELAAGVAHELNNPLGVIRGYLTVLRKGIQDAQSNKDLDIIADEVNQCQRIVQGLLELARPRPLELQPVELVGALGEALERLDRVRGPDSPKLTFSSTPATIQATVDIQAVKRVVVNLVNNATDAAGPDGEVGVRVEETSESVTISVSDTGEGIPPELKDDLFKPFHTTKRHGTGLGLAICDTLVRAHGGHIDVTDGPKGGALFRVVIPLNRGAGAGT